MAFSLVNTVQVGTDPVTGTITLALGTLSAGNGVIVGVSMLDSTSVTVSGVTCGGESLTSTAAITRVTTGNPGLGFDNSFTEVLNAGFTDYRAVTTALG